MKLLGIQCICCILGLVKAAGQDSLSIQNLTPLTSTFTIVDSQLVGEGADFLENEIKAAQFTILGDYGNSKNIADFTKAIIPELDKMNYKTMAIDVGPISTEILNRYPHGDQDMVSAIKSQNDRYGFIEGDRFHFPMPILSGLEESEYLETSKILNWSLIGLNNDSWNGLSMLIDELHDNIPDEQKQLYLTQYKAATKELSQMYKNRNGDLLTFVSDFRASLAIQEFIKIATTSKENLRIIESINYSIKKCEQYAQKVYFEKNRDRIPYEKRLLRDQLETLNFDLSKDKLLVKVNRRHASKGFQPDGFYGFANTLQEFATYHGNKSIHIGFFRRFFIEDGQIKDELNLDYHVRDRYHDVIQMGKADKWTIIDLRPLIEGSYYSQKYILSPWIENLMKQYDLIIIPPTERPVEANHSFSTE